MGTGVKCWPSCSFSGAWVLIIAFAIVVFIFVSFYIQESKRIEVVKNKMLYELPVPIRKTILRAFLEKCSKKSLNWIYSDSDPNFNDEKPTKEL